MRSGAARSPFGPRTSKRRGSFTPLSLTSLRAWWCSDFGITIATGVSSWLDRSGNGNTLLQAVGAKQPTVTAAAINGRDAVTFDGTDDILQATFTLAQPLTVFAMMRQETWTLNEIMMDGVSGLTLAVQQVTASPQFRVLATGALGPDGNMTVGSFSLMRVISDGASSSMQVNNSTANTGTLTGTPGGITLGARGNDTVHANVSYAEVIVMAAAATAGEIAQVKAYMTSLYGVP